VPIWAAWTNGTRGRAEGQERAVAPVGALAGADTIADVIRSGRAVIDDRMGRGLELRRLVWAVGDRAFATSDPLRVSPGEVAAVLAAPDVGTALADVLVGLARPRQGEVRVDEWDAARPSGLRRIALIPAGGGLLPHLTVAKNIGVGLLASRPRERRAKALRLTRELRLEGAFDMQPHRLSPEQQLRVAVARALISEPAAVVIEDRVGQVPCGPAVRAALDHGAAVLVITNSDRRASAATTSVHAVHPDGGDHAGDAR
jgi:ABC-type lipoprotein export system ATPase subunit